MNYLAHFFLAYPDPELMAGGYLGDFVKGTLKDADFSPGVTLGIKLHRAIDAFTDSHSTVKELSLIHI